MICGLLRNALLSACYLLIRFPFKNVQQIREGSEIFPRKSSVYFAKLSAYSNKVFSLNTSGNCRRYYLISKHERELFVLIKNVCVNCITLIICLKTISVGASRQTSPLCSQRKVEKEMRTTVRKASTDYFLEWQL